MTKAEADAYLASLNQQRVYAARETCNSIWEEQTLNLAGVQVAYVKNTTAWCRSGGYLVASTISVQPHEHHVPGYSTQNRIVDIGYPTGYKRVRRNLCVLENVYLVYSGGFDNWNLSARDQVRGNGSYYQQPGGDSVGCYANVQVFPW
jgi:hypothetical protein